MFQHKDHSGLSLEPVVSIDAGEDSDLRLAYILQNAQPGDPAILKLLVERYAGELTRMVCAVLDGVKRRDENTADIVSIVQSTFATAMARVDRFWGETSVQNWLFSIAVELIRRQIRKRNSREPTDIQPGHPGWLTLSQVAPSTETDSWTWQEIDALPWKIRLAVIMHYLHGMNIDDVADVLKEKVDALQRALSGIRRQIVRHGGIPHPNERILPPGDPQLILPGQQTSRVDGWSRNQHVKFQKRIEAQLDGILEDENDAYVELDGHLLECEDCRAYLERIQRLETILASSLQHRWPLPSFEPDQLGQLQDAVSHSLVDIRPSVNRLPLRHMVSAIIVIFAFTGLFWVFNRVDLDRIEQPSWLNRAPTPLPTPVQLEITSVKPFFPRARGQPAPPDYPQLTAAARWEGFNAHISSLAISPDMRFFAAGASDGAVYLLDGSEGRLLHEFKGVAQGAVTSLSFSSDGERLAAGTSQGDVVVWRSTDASRVLKLQNHPGKVLFVGFTKDGTNIFAGTSDQVWLWELGDSKSVRKAILDYRQVTIIDIALAPDGDLLALAMDDGTVWLQIPPSEEVVLRLGRGKGLPQSVEFSSDSKTLVVGWKDGWIDLWKIESLENGLVHATFLSTLKRSGEVRRVDFSEDGRTVASGALFGRAIKLWSIPWGKLVEPVPPKDESYRPNGVFAFNGQALVIASETGDIYVWKEAERAIKSQFFQRASVNTFGPSSNTVLPLSQVGLNLLGFIPIQDGQDLSVYQVAESVNNDLFAPAILSPGFELKQAYKGKEGEAGLIYIYENVHGDKTEIHIQQKWMPAPINWPLVGANAVVEKAAVHNRYAEYVKGGWEKISDPADVNSGNQPAAQWEWKETLSIQRLIWKSGDRVFAIGVSELGMATDLMTKDILISIAESMQSLPSLEETPPELITHKVVEGDTCYGIAVRYGTTTEELARLNHLDSGCDFIYPGQELVVPLPAKRLPLAERDLDCNGVTERLRVIPAPIEPLGSYVFGVVLESPTPSGIYHPVWTYTIAAANATIFTDTVLLATNPCDSYLSISVIGDEGSEQRVFRWDGEKMNLIMTSKDFESKVYPEWEPLPWTTGYGLIFIPKGSPQR